MKLDAVTIVLALGGLCVVGAILIFALQFLGGILSFLTQFINLFFGILAGGPLAWCGCLIAIGGLCGCGMLVLYLVNVLPTCGTAQAINLCRLFGY